MNDIILMKGGLVELKRVPNVIYDILMEMVGNDREEDEDCSDDSDNVDSMKDRLCQGPNSDGSFCFKMSFEFSFLVSDRCPWFWSWKLYKNNL